MVSKWSKLLFVLAVIVLKLFRTIAWDEDYFMEDYDENKNCHNEEELRKLVKENPRQCKSISGRDSKGNQSFIACRKELSRILVKEICQGTRVKKAGRMSYCIVRGTTTCCFE